MDEDGLRLVQYEVGEDWADFGEDINGLWAWWRGPLSPTPLQPLAHRAS